MVHLAPVTVDKHRIARDGARVREEDRACSLPSMRTRLPLSMLSAACVAVAVGLGSPLLDDALRGGSLSELADRARTALAEATRG